jgi:hypothetical protein
MHRPSDGSPAPDATALSGEGDQRIDHHEQRRALQRAVRKSPRPDEKMFDALGLVTKEIVKASRSRTILSHCRPAEAQRRYCLVVGFVINNTLSGSND